MARYKRKDHLHQRAKQEGLRSRAAYKLEEIQQQFGLLSAGDRVFDLGCWPGGWLEVAARLVGPTGRVVGVDLAEIDPPIALPQVATLVGDLEDPEIAAALLAAIAKQTPPRAGNASVTPSETGTAVRDEASADVVLSDAAPKLTGVREIDRANEERLLLAIERLLPALLAPGGALVLKILEGPEAQAIDRRLRQSFAKARTVKLRATRKGSTERYLVARGLRR